MILPIEQIEARLAQQCPGLPDVSEQVSARAWLYDNDWPMHQIAAGLYLTELRRAGVAYLVAVKAAVEVQLALGVLR